MKIEKSKQFSPISITIETEEELSFITKLMLEGTGIGSSYKGSPFNKYTVFVNNLLFGIA